MCLLGTFSPYITVHQASVVKIEPDIPLEVAALVGCGVTTGWGSATKVADVRPGENVVVMGAGGVGMNAVQGAAAAGAKRVMVIEPVQKREWAMNMGATHTFASIEEATARVNELTWGRMAEKTIITVGDIQGEDIAAGAQRHRQGRPGRRHRHGQPANVDVKLSLFELTLLQKDLQGAIFGGLSPRAAIPELLSLYQEGQLKLDELVTTRYSLEDINQGYQDMRDGKNIRGMIVYTDADRRWSGARPAAGGRGTGTPGPDHGGGDDANAAGHGGAGPSRTSRTRHRQEELRALHSDLRLIAQDLSDEVLRCRVHAVCARLAALGTGPVGEPSVRLAPRETDVLAMVALGYSNAESPAGGRGAGDGEELLSSAMASSTRTPARGRVAARRLGLLP